MNKIRYDYPIMGERNLKIPLMVQQDEAVEASSITVKYKQATILETIIFLQETEELDDYSKRFFDFLQEFGDLTKVKEKLLRLDVKAVQKIFTQILKTRFKGVFESEGNNKNKGGRRSLYSAALTTVCEKLSIDPDTFQKKYTVEQFNRFIKGISFTINEGSEAGRKENDRISFNEQHDDDELIKMLAKWKK